MKRFPLRPSLSAITVLAVLCGLGVSLRADSSDATDPVSISGDAAVTVSDLGAAPEPSSGMVAQTTFVDYRGLLSGTVEALNAPLAALLSASGKPGISVAAGGFRELVTGERSPFCDHLDKDLSDRLRDDTPYGVPSTTELADAWVGIGGSSADLSRPYTLARFGHVLTVDAVVSGDYRVQGPDVLLRVRLLRCFDGAQLWSALERLPISALDRADLDTYAGSAPPGYGVSIPAPPPPSLSGSAGAGLVPGKGGASASSPAGTYLSGVRLESDVHETEFSIYRVNFGAGYEYEEPTNPAFRAVVHNLSSPYLELNWADIARLQFYGWYQSSVRSSAQDPISSLFGYGLDASLTLPVRLGHYWVLYGGVGGRFETIDVNSPLVPSRDTVSFGNNSVFATAGFKVHIRSVGVDTAVSYAPNNFSDQSGYFTARLGMYYEWNFE
ncbi:MAG: hypothetical protein ACREKE_07335 [bacterium]